MAKKKVKKILKAERASLPPSPKPVSEDLVPALPENLLSLPGPAETESIPDDTVQPIAPPTEPNVEDPVVGAPEVEASEDSIAEDAEFVKQEEEARVPTEEKVESISSLEPSKEIELSEKPAEALGSDQIAPAKSTSQEIEDTISAIEPQAPSEPVPTEIEQADDTEKTLSEPSEPVKVDSPLTAEDSVSEAPATPEPVQATPEPVQTAPAPQPESVEKVEEPIAAPEPQLEPVKPVEEPVPEPELRPDSPATIRAPSPQHIELQPTLTELELNPAPVPVPVATVYAPSPKRSQSHPALTAPEEPSAPSPPPVERQATLETRERPKSPPKPIAAALVIEDDRPPAPTPPVGRIRPRHSIAFDSDDDDDDLALVQPRLRGDPSRVATYPPQSSHPRSLFASRVPAEHYSPPPPQPPPPGYHPRYYPPAAPQYPPAAPQYPPAAPQYHPNHAYSMSQSGGYPNPGSYGPPSHGSSPYQESWGQFPPTYPPYGSPQRHDSIGSREYPMGPPSIENGSSTVEDDTSDVFSRIAQAIPDLHVLLAKYKETHGQLGVREDLLRRAGVEQQEKLRSKDEEIHHLKDRLSRVETKHSSDASRLRLEIGNMEEQMKEVREQIAETEKFKKEAEETRLALDAAKASWVTRCKKFEDAKANLEKTALEEKDKAQKEFDDWRSTANTRHDAEKIALAIQFDKKLKEADVINDKQRQEAAANFVKEKDELRSEHQRQQRERESNYDRVRKELETKLSTAQKDREEALIHERESREVWEAERETLAKAYQEDREGLQRGWDEQRELLDGQYRKNKEESDKAWIELHADANKKAEEEKARADRLTKEKEELQWKYNELLAESQREKEVIKSVAGNLENEKARLEKLMECYGDIAEIKKKGDTY